MDPKTIENQLEIITSTHRVMSNEPLSNYTYTKMGGNADFLVFPTSSDEVQDIYLFASENNIPVTVLGNGSNLIIQDGGIRGIVINLTKMNSIMVSDNKIVAQSGAAIIDVSRTALSHGLTGMEFACGIPGSVGGALYMNAGAYGGEISDVLESATLLNRNGELVILTKDELGLEYRKSIIGSGRYIVLESRFSLISGENSDILNKMDELTYLRESKQPLEYPSCGSVFKRPPNNFAGKLIQESGLQGYRIGGAEVSRKHSGFIVNVDHATSKEYIDLIEHVQKTVKDTFDVSLEREVKIIGEEKTPETIPAS